MNTILNNIEKMAFKHFKNKKTVDQFMDAYASMSIDEQYNFYQYFIIDKVDFLKALDAALFPPTPRPLRYFEDNE